MCIVHSTLRDATTPYTNRYPQAENQPHILALSVFADTQIQRCKNQKS